MGLITFIFVSSESGWAFSFICVSGMGGLSIVFVSGADGLSVVFVTGVGVLDISCACVQLSGWAISIVPIKLFVTLPLLLCYHCFMF